MRRRRRAKSNPLPRVRCARRGCKNVHCEHHAAHVLCDSCGVPDRCYDHRPCVAGGVLVWCELVEADK